MLKTVTETAPKCFGLHFEAEAPECVGGYDPSYNDNPGHIRERCNYAGSCSEKVAGVRTQPLIPASSLTSRPYTSFGNVPAGYARPTSGAPAVATNGVPSAPWRPPTAYPPVATPLAGFSPHYGVPQYISMREPQTSGGLGKRLGLEVLRSMGKSFGHTIAHFFDVEAFGVKPPTGRPPGDG